jgi:uncharacterized protein
MLWAWPSSYRRVRSFVIFCPVLVASLGFVRAQGLGPDFRMVCWSGDADRAAALLQQGAPLEQTDSYGRTPLILAAHGNPDIVKLLLAHGAKVDATEPDGDTPLCLAAEQNMVANAQALVTAGADINHVNRYNRTPLELAARDGQDDVVSYLLAQHASLTAGDPKSPPLMYAVWKDHLSTAKLLLAAGESVAVPQAVKAAGGEWATTMQNAAYTADAALIDLLLDHGGDINESDSNGRTAFDSLVMRSTDVALISHLLDRGANPNAAGKDGASAFMLADNWSSPEVVKLLVAHGANVNAQDATGRTELMVMAAYNNLAKVNGLLAFHPDVNLQDKAGETALTYAGSRGGVEVVKALEQAGATPRSFHIIPKPLHETLTSAQKWALAVGAIYAQCNAFSRDSLAQDPDDKDMLAKRVNEDWGVKGHDDLLEVLNDLELPASAKYIALEEAEDVMSSNGVRDAFHKLRENAYLDAKWQGRVNLAWDACREANLAREGVTAGYITEEEAWPILLRNARRVQQAYKSWGEMSDSFLDSREILAGERDPDFRACADLLLNPQDPNSPWNQLPWNTDLGK